MNPKVKSIRPFIGAKDFKIAQAFYQDLGFEESVLSPNMSYFKMGDFGFYLQDAYVKDWVDNTMVFMEIINTRQFYQYLLSLNLSSKYPEVRLLPIKELDWGRECFLHDPSGILWHFGEFN